MSGSTRLPEADRLRADLTGDLVLPGDAAYDEAREIFNAMHDLRPGGVVRVADPSDVAVAVRHAADHGLELSVRGGGHSIPGFSSCDGGLTIDLRPLCRVEVRPEERRARVGGGATWGQLNDAAHAHELATPGGVISTTGVGGLTLGGGIGYLSRQHGLACDNLLAAEVVTADGAIVRCDERTRPDLFWAIRGGGGNFGVVTELEFRLHPAGEIVGGPTFFLPEPGVLSEFASFLAGAPREYGALLGVSRAPGLPFIPEKHHGAPAVALISCWNGGESDLPDLLASLDACGTVIGRHIGPMPYPAINTLFDDLLPFGLRHYWKSLVAESIPDAAAEQHVLDAPSVPNVESGFFFHPIDGACTDVPEMGTAFPHRDAAFVVGIYGSWHDAAEDDRHRRWVREIVDKLRPHYRSSEYVNFAPADDLDAPRSIYGPNYERLARVKATYDPENLFRRNQNVPPA